MLMINSDQNVSGLLA